VGAPAGTVTFLFTDIEGSTARWEADPKGMRAALAAHDEVLREAIEASGGWMFKHTGDGVCAAFASAQAAVDAAVAAQRLLELPVRMGLATGAAEPGEGDYFGPVVNRTARVMAAGHGGQVLVAASTASLVDGVDLVDLGPHQLRDLSEPLRLFQVRAEGLPTDLPPLRTVDVAPGNLRAQATSFVGREREITEVSNVVRKHRLVTLTGAGGVGKTRLALQVAAGLTAEFMDGVWLCELVAAANAEEMAEVVARTLGVVQRPQMTVEESIVDFLRPQQLLVVLDNCEHLVDHAARLADAIISGAPQVTVLATSQESLGLSAEREWRLRSLALKAGGADLAFSEAVTLFVERAAAANQAFVLDSGTLPSVDEICGRLDGIPLAIELAAARTKVMTPAEIAAHLDERFRLLVRGPKDQLKRHQTMLEALRWSYSLLSQVEKLVFDRLGVFPGSFDEAAAIAVCSDDEIARWDVIESLEGLVSKSLVEADQQEGSTRYHLLETMRLYGRDQAAAGGDPEGLRRRHALYYADVAVTLAAGLSSPEELIWQAKVGRDVDNLRAATAWSFNAASPEDQRIGVRIIASLLNKNSPGDTWGVGVWALAAVPLVDSFETGDRAVVLVAAGTQLLHLSIDQAMALSQRVLDEVETFNYWVLLAVVQVALGWSSVDAAKATAVLDDGLRRVESYGGGDQERVTLSVTRAWIAHYTGDDVTALAAAQDALVRARRMGLPSGLAVALSTSARMVSDDPDESLALAQEALDLIDRGASFSPGSAAQTAALVLLDRGEVSQAAGTLARAIAQVHRAGDRVTMGPTVAVTAIVLSRADPRAAASLTGAHHGTAIGPPFLGTMHLARYAQMVEELRNRLGERGFTEAEARGTSMTFDELAAFAVNELKKVQSQTVS
jgi:predicted ATPase